MTESTRDQAAGGSANNAGIDWQAVLTRHGRWLRTVVYSRLHDHDEVDEVMQEVALSVVRQTSPLLDASKLAPWLYRVAVRQALLFRRRCGRQRRLLAKYFERIDTDLERSSSDDPFDWLLASERRELVRAALERLHPLDAEVLLLKYTENWSYDEIASHLGVSHGAVESRLHRARRRLRSTLAELQVVEVPK